MRQDNPPRLLYHYTTAEGLKGIVESNALRFTHVYYLNDRKEYFWGLDLFIEALKNARNSQTDSGLIEELERRRDESTGAIDPIGANMAGGIDDQPARRASNVLSHFVFSLSEKRDSLSQWRAYCPHGGYAIGFDFHLLAAIYGLHAVGKCVYIKDKNEFNQRKGQTVSEMHSRIGPEEERSAYLGSQIEIDSYSFFIKHKSFEEEKEWRIIQRPTTYSDENNEAPKTNIKFRAKGSTLVPYIESRGNGRSGIRIREAIRKIVLSPGTDPQMAVTSIATLFNNYGRKAGLGTRGNHVKITPSSSPYRYA